MDREFTIGFRHMEAIGDVDNHLGCGQNHGLKGVKLQLHAIKRINLGHKTLSEKSHNKLGFVFV